MPGLGPCRYPYGMRYAPALSTIVEQVSRYRMDHQMPCHHVSTGFCQTCRRMRHSIRIAGSVVDLQKVQHLVGSWLHSMMTYSRAQLIRFTAVAARLFLAALSAAVPIAGE